MLGSLRKFSTSAAVRHLPKAKAGKQRCQWGMRRVLHNSARVTEEATPGKLPARFNASMAAPIPSINLNSVAQEVVYHNMWGAIKSFPKRRPFAFNVMLSGTLVPLADFVTQKAEGGPFNWRRSVLFFVFGMYNGTMWYFVYLKAFGYLFPRAIPWSNLSWAQKLADREGCKQLVGQVCADIFVYAPFGYFPAFYVFKSYLQGFTNGTETFVEAFRKAKQNFVVDNICSVSFSGPMDVVSYSLPAWLRLPFQHGCAFFWNIGLSWGRGGMQPSQ